VIPKDHYHTIVEGTLACGQCAADLRDVLKRTSTVYTDDCFVCNKVIPKDHKIIERFGVRVCEECACPSDIVIEDNKNLFNGEGNFVK
jgi:activator of HSP90 ATPase